VCSGEAFKGKPKLEMLLGVVRTAAGKTVIDFGCGEGLEAIELAKFGSKMSSASTLEIR